MKRHERILFTCVFLVFALSLGAFGILLMSVRNHTATGMGVLVIGTALCALAIAAGAALGRAF